MVVLLSVQNAVTQVGYRVLTPSGGRAELPRPHPRLIRLGGTAAWGPTVSVRQPHRKPVICARRTRRTKLFPLVRRRGTVPPNVAAVPLTTGVRVTVGRLV
jgi:hypothetical protein